MSVTLYTCMFCVALSMDMFVCCVSDMFENCLVKQFAIYLGVVVILLNVVVLFIVAGGALFDIPFIVFQRVCVCYACDPHVHLDVPSICFVCVFACRKVSPHLRV